MGNHHVRLLQSRCFLFAVGRVRAGAAYALGDLGGPMAEQALRETLDTEPEGHVRRAAQQAIEKVNR